MRMSTLMKTIIYTCPYVPAEWIAAHGLRASRLMLDRIDSHSSIAPTEGVCPFVRSFISEVERNSGLGAVVVTTLCDQMRRAFDILVRRCELPAFLMNVPNTWQTLAAQRLYTDELKRLGRFLVGLGGQSPSTDALANVMLRHDSARTSILAKRAYLSARQFAEAIAAFGRDGPGRMTGETTNREPLTQGVPLAIIGGPLMRQDFEIFDMAEQFGGRIVLDATETGERGMCAAFDRRRLRDEPLTELAGAYFGGIQDASRRPNSELYKWLKTELSGRAVRGIIFHRYVWCDMWHAELRRLKDWIELPVLDIDTAGDGEANRQRTANKIRAFLEMLQ
jgi:benzoyl-CoA reductase/2-hydroxyglutaryl-CoA dehydratase subunit BcrC/BadD/HgdB